ncbi:bifunctional adenosylcobinamide kinase/adenosylcobinamide-phosphate guanylyltransferase [Alkalihalobacillus sp. MEB130]|uniref:bifunctional adenosylcobinamide kinase/adenosylcobinamide-phosphate guanylyltransferase n=1 Tax=Alkalihalobacillus sp. MEB130 TaxID=2976704 RepID=UPI0028DE5F06|nr:bifunctional adenosylcobinamide kinase/adenosylcobinamide-phosphate guanylyltransferase [Alkalihalobacillus sp. MEB130]MDT8859292.1 bifunctional adenosylcobinamide kinase/adenosylcobinamide-phosphate guanylyltransferase [Alkalihalobacillus sp. MEB130]
MIIFVSGGARSGKSRFAEELAVSIYRTQQEKTNKGRLYYIATSKRSDTEMEERIKIHQNMRVKEWETHEESYGFHSFLDSCKKTDVILVDCLTIWVSNVMFDLHYNSKQIEMIVNEWVKIAWDNDFHLIFVSNDVNEELPHSSQGVQQYMYMLQVVHKIIVQQADKAIQVIAGLPTYWKGKV